MVNINEMDIDNGSTNATGDERSNTGVPGFCDGFDPVDLLIRSIWMYAGYPILALGTVGHSLVIFLLLRNKRMRSLPLSVLVLTMSASGLLALYVGLLPTIIKHHTCHHVVLDDITEAGCRVLNAAIYFSLQLYSWMEVSVAVERMCAVRWVFTLRTFSTKSMNTIAILGIITILMALNGIHFKIFGMNNNTCDVEDINLFNIWQYVHTITYIILPVAVMIPANVVTLHTMYRSPLKNSTNVKNAKPVAIMMFILNVIFVVTTTPLLVGDYHQLAGHYQDAVRIAWVASRLMMYLGCSLTFLVYVAVASKFRRAIAELLYSGNKKIRRALAVLSNMSASNGETDGTCLASASDQHSTV